MAPLNPRGPSEPRALLYKDWGLPRQVWFPSLPAEVTWRSLGEVEAGQVKLSGTLLALSTRPLGFYLF